MKKDAHQPTPPAATAPNHRSSALTCTQRALILRTLPVVEAVARSVARSHQAPDELRSAGYEALVRAAHRFDEAQGVPFGPFAALHVRWAMLKALRAERRQRHARLEDDAYGVAPVEPTPHAEEVLAETERTRTLERTVSTALGALAPTDRAIVVDHYYREVELKSMVQRGASYATVRRRHHGALEKLGRCLRHSPAFVSAIMS